MTRYEIYAPFHGIVITKHMAKGEWVRESADILCVADLSDVWVDITVYGKDLDLVRLGQKVTVTSNSSDLSASGKISYIGPLVGEETRTARARVVLGNAQGKWRPGMFVTVKIVRKDEEVPLAVREDAVQTMDRYGSVVFVQYGEQFEVRPVELGRSDGTNVGNTEGPVTRREVRCRQELHSQVGVEHGRALTLPLAVRLPGIHHGENVTRYPPFPLKHNTYFRRGVFPWAREAASERLLDGRSNPEVLH